MDLLRPTAFFRPNNVSKVTIIKKLRAQPLPFFLLLLLLLLLSSFSFFLFLLSFSFVSVILELIGPKSLPFDAFSLK